MTANPYWPRQTLSTTLANAARDRPAQEALVISGRRMTYAQLWKSVQEVAAALMRPASGAAITLQCAWAIRSSG